ncbi:ABC transporter ATP-binding protein, partial [Nguyenibacter vanlangensis]|nr:ABC transporter ATP-binding protein [Nguyenibacter vanlangensis]
DGQPAKRPERGPEKGAAKGPARKLSYKDQLALDRLPGQIAALEADITRLRAVLSDAGLYARDPQAFTDATTKLDRAETELTAAEERWLELEMLREALGSS